MLFYSVVVIVLYARRLLTLSVNLMIHLSTAPALQYGYQGTISPCPLSVHLLQGDRRGTRVQKTMNHMDLSTNR